MTISTPVRIPTPTIAEPTTVTRSSTAPTITAPAITAPTIAAPTVTAPAITAPTIAAPTIAAPTIAAPKAAVPEVSAPAPITLSGSHSSRAVDILRIALGFIFLWPFLDKTFGLGYSTTHAQAWIHGGSPTEGFLGHVEVGPLQSVFRSIAGAGWADWLFMLGLLGIGVALIAGVVLRIAAVAGVVLVLSMWAAEWPLAQHTSTGAATGSTNPFLDYHLIFAIGLVVVAVLGTASSWGLGAWWAKTPFVTGKSFLR